MIPRKNPTKRARAPVQTTGNIGKTMGGSSSRGWGADLYGMLSNYKCNSHATDNEGGGALTCSPHGTRARAVPSMTATISTTKHGALRTKRLYHKHPAHITSRSSCSPDLMHAASHPMRDLSAIHQVSPLLPLRALRCSSLRNPPILRTPPWRVLTGASNIW
jgi:hypothetical protein